MEERISQISLQPNLLKKLLQKLKVGDRRGIHLNATPGRSKNRLDVFDLSYISKELLNNFLDVLFGKDSFEFEINFDKVKLEELSEDERNKLVRIASNLDYMTYDVTSNFLQYGVKNFGVGYPLLVKRDEGNHEKIIKAPLLIWNLDIKKHSNKKDSWVISREPHFPIIANELLRNHIDNDMKVKLNALSADILDDGIVDIYELNEICKNFLEQLNAQQEKIPDLKRPEKCLNTEQARLAGQRASILPMGSFGIYAAQKGVFIDTLENELLDTSSGYYDHPAVLNDFQETTSTPVSIDPSKEEILNTLTQDEIKLIQGPPGTGKSQALSAIISNALSNGAKCLLVCEKKTALDVIYANLRKIELDDLCVKVYRVDKDRGDVIRKARDREDQVKDHIFSETIQLVSKKKEAELSDILKNYNMLHQSAAHALWGDMNWKDVIGKYLQLAREYNGEKILKDLDRIHGYSYEDYQKLSAYIQQMALLFERVSIDRRHPLLDLPDEVLLAGFTKMTRDNFKEYFIQRGDLLVKINQSLQSLNQNYVIRDISPLSVDSSGIYKTVSGACEVLEKGVRSLSFLGGIKYESLKISVIDRIKGLLSSQIKERVDHQKNVLRSLSLIGYQYTNQSTDHVVPILNQSLNAIYQEKSHAEHLQKAVTEVRSLESQIEKEDKEYFNQTLVSIDDMQSLERYHKTVLLELERTEKIVKAIPELQDIAQWRRAYKNSDNFEKSLINTLLDQGCDKWQGIVESWYLYRFLNMQESGNDFHTSSQALSHIQGVYNEVKAHQVKAIQAQWGIKAQGAIGRVNENKESTGGFTMLYNLRKNKKFGRSNSLRSLVHLEKPSGFDVFTDLFPVVLTNPASAEAFLPMKAGLFDLVIFDEASQLKLEETYGCMLRGKYKIIAGDVHQMPPATHFSSSVTGDEYDESESDEEAISGELAQSESLLEYASLLPQARRSYLDYHYRSQHPALINFSNVAIYGGNLVPFPEKDMYVPIDFYQVNGLYHSNINAQEIDKVIDILKSLTSDRDGDYPSVGIATFNQKQRNAILDRISQEVIADESFRARYAEIDAGGFWIKNLENIQGDEMDIIILSTTFGIDKNERFARRFGPIGQGKGYKLLNVLVTRAKYKVIVCTSVPESEYMSFEQEITEHGNNRRGIFYAYLAYARAISDEDSDRVEYILRCLKEGSHDAARNYTSRVSDFSESPFEQEVYEALCKIIPENLITQQFKVGGFRIDMVVEKNGKKIAIECDGKEYHSSTEAYAHDMYRQKELEDLGFTFYRIWSTNWWQDYGREIEKLKKYFLLET